MYTKLKEDAESVDNATAVLDWGSVTTLTNFDDSLDKTRGADHKLIRHGNR
jgi:hypothetical protein